MQLNQCFHSSVRTIIMSCAFSFFALPGLSSSTYYCFAGVTKSITPNAEKLGWHVTGWHYALKDSGFHEVLNTLSKIGICYIEGAEFLDLSSKKPGVQNNYKQSEANRKETKRRMDSLGISMPVCYSRTVQFKDTANFRKVFDFMKEMGVTTMSCDPLEDPRVYGKLDKLCAEYKINLAMHNHPKSAFGWHPDSLAKIGVNQSQTIGGCSDVGNWQKSGLNPLKSLQSFHSKRLINDVHLHDMAKSLKDTTVGKGIIDATAILEQLYEWEWKGTLSIEIENQRNYPLLVKEIIESAEFIERFATAKLVSGTSASVPLVIRQQNQDLTFISIGNKPLSIDYNKGLAVYNILGKRIFQSNAVSLATEQQRQKPDGFFISVVRNNSQM